MAAIEPDALIEHVYAAAADPAQWRPVLDNLCDALSGVGMFFMHDLECYGGSLACAARMEDDYQFAYDRYYAARNPWLHNLPKRPVGLAVPAEFMLERAELKRTEFFSDFLRPQGLLSGVGVTLLQDRKRFVALSVLYSAKASERERANVALVQRLAPHLVRACQINRQLGAAEFRWRAAEASLEQIANGVIIVDAKGRMIFANVRAENIIKRRDGLSLDCKGRLIAGNPGDDAGLQSLVRRAVDGCDDKTEQAGGVVAIRRPSGRRAYSLLVAPLNPPVSPFHGPTRVVAIFIADPAEPRGIAAGTLVALFGMTATEARLAARLSAGDGLDAAANELGLAKETARGHLKSIFAKTEVNRQAELAALLARLMVPGRTDN